MDRDAARMRPGKPYIFTDMKRGVGLGDIVAWIERDVMFEDAA
jgi:urease accessory protein